MKRNSKRFLSLFLAVPMTLSLMSMPVSAAPTGSADQQVQEETAAPETSEDTQEAADTDTAEETQDSAAGADQESSRTETDTENSAADNAGEDAEISINLEDSLTTFTVDASKIEAPEITPNEMQLSEEELDAVDTSDPEIATIEEELKSIKVLDAEGNSVALTDEQIQRVLGMYGQYQQQWQANADVLGVQSPFYLMFNDNGEDGLGVLGEMLCLAGVSVEDVRSGNYSYDDLTGMIMNFLYGDMYGIQYYGETIKEKRNEALQAVKDSGAQTDVQKIMALNTWLSQNSSFDMSYIMNQMDPDNPIMTAEDQKPHPHYQELYDAMYEEYEGQIRDQFHDQFYAQVEAGARQEAYKAAIKDSVKQGAIQQGSSEEEANAAAEAYMTEHEEEINADPRAYLANMVNDEQQMAVIDERIEAQLANEEVQQQLEAQTQDLMDTVPLEDLGGMTANQAIPVVADQAAVGLANGIIGYWEGNHIGALAEGKAVCMGYAKAFAYLMQCMYPEYYLKDGATDITVAENWKTASELYYDEEGNLDIDQDYNVDLVRITFDAAVSMYGIPQPDFSSDHFWNAVKVDGKWYYVDPCYTDVFSEVMNRDRVETNGYMNHTYFMISHSSLAEMFDGNYKEIKTLYADCTGSTVNADYTSSDYEGSWVTRAVSNVYSDGTYMYYMYDSTDMLEMLRQFNDSEGNYQDMDIEDAVYKIVRHQMDGDDMGDGDEDYETLIDFNSDESGSVMVRNAEGEMVANEMLTELYAQFVEEQSVYPAIHTTPVLYEGKLYFNVSNCILSYDLESGEVVKVKEYNTVSATRDKTEVFGAMAFDVVDNAEGADFTFENHPIAGMTLKGDTLYVDIATNLSYIAGKADLYDYASEGYGYAYEESNYNPDYNEFSAQMMEDQGISDDMLEQLGYKREINDNSEFMWVANAVETMDMTHFAGTSHTYEDVTVDAYCGCDGYTESRCTECGAIETDSRTTEEGTAHTHHYLLYQETYYTTEDDVTSETDPSTVTWNSGESYVCAECGFHISEPTEPKKNGFVTDEEYEEQLAEYEKNKEIYDEAVKTAGHTYTAAEAQWSEDYTTVTFSALECSSVCPERADSLDLLINTAEKYPVSVTLDEEVTANSTIAGTEGTCAEGVTTTYSATAEVDGQKYTVTAEKTWEAGEHNYVDGKCTKCGEADPDALVAPEIESVYSTEQTSVKVTWNEIETAYGYELWRADSADAAEDQWTRVKTIYSGDDSNIQYAKDAEGEIRTDENGVKYIYYRNVQLDVGKTYYYKVRSFGLQTGTEFSTEDDTNRIYSAFSEVKYMPSAVVLGDIYSAATDKVRLNWTEVKGAHGYQIWRLDEKDGEYKIVKTLGDKDNVLTDNQGATTAYSNVGLEAGKTYLYKIRAFMIPGDGTKVFGAYSDEFTVAVMPESTKISVNSSRAGRADVSWDAVSGAAGYQIWMQGSGGEYKLVKSIEDGNTDSYVKYDLKSGSTYKFRVRAYTQVDDKKTFGAYSNEVSVKVK